MSKERKDEIELIGDQRFVEIIMQWCSTDKGIAARLRRGDNPATEYQSWDVLGTLGVNLEKESTRLAYVTVAATIAKFKATSNGHQTLGGAIASCYDDGRESSQAKARLRRLLACDDVLETCRILRPILALITSRTSQTIDFVRLLKQLRNFTSHGQSVKAQWAQEFYRQLPAEGVGEGAV